MARLRDRETAEGTSKKAPPTKILVVEDNKVNVKVLLLLLVPFKFECDTAENGREAVEAVKNNHYNLILMDVHMPKRDGLEATQIIRQMEKVSGVHTPILAVTALTTSADKQKCLDAGMDDHIPKPIDRQLLCEKLNHWLKRNLQSKTNESIVEITHYEGVWLDPEDLKRILEHFGDENFRKLLRNYLTSSQTYIASLKSLLAEHDKFQSLSVLQELNSASADVGARTICKFCRELNEFVSGEEWVDAVERYDDLQETFQQLSTFLEGRLTSKQL
ncbi:MAG: response regulator [Candidatus Melainabacteria bacterium]|nr:response regulator [Candidatus Melainabacteria bacterium]